MGKPQGLCERRRKGDDVKNLKVQSGKIFTISDAQGRFWMGPTLLTWEAPKELGADVPCWMTTSRESALAQAALLECVTPQSIFLETLDESIEFHQNNANDPHNISNAVITALREVRRAVVKSLEGAA
jgi:hypothetical protein